ncbi:MAG TPA: hypothetical protein VG711_02505 [Phycisphaerales bacterium]|nr:hypothetical protein [Phycisphaerales bacterium]
MIRITNTLLWLTLIALVGTIIATAVSAGAVFSTLPKMHLHLDQYSAYPANHHGLLAAGHVMDNVFAVVNPAVLVAAPLACVLMILATILMNPLPGRLIRIFACLFLFAAAAVMLLYQIMNVPRMNQHLVAYRQAAAAGDIETADAEHAEFTGLHNMTDMFFQASSGALTLAVVCWAFGSPAVKPQSHQH